MITETGRLERSTDLLLEFVRAGRLAPTVVSPAALVARAVEAVGTTQIELCLEGAPAEWVLDGDRMAQVLDNVLRNAVQAGTPLEVTVSLAAGRLLLSVRDHGPGLPEGDPDRVFDPFFTTRATGTGLGLAIARRIVQAHGGAIDAKNHAAGGAVLSIELPLR